MANLFNDDFREFIQELNKQEVEYLLVGGYAVILHGYRRSTGGLDVWVNITVGNYKKLVQAFLAFGLPTEDISEDIFLRNDEMDVFTYGVPPVCIDVMKKVKGCDFDEAYKMSKLFDENGLQIRYVHIDTLIKSKIASGRYKDLDDIEKLSG
ncbi:MAG: hypothetical protein IPL84_12830 [Chitinophagaceae bacterium]|nr:hypothetical protein [Chitinophagaceae bacterium]